MPDLLNAEVTAQIRQVFAGLKHPVHLLFFGRSQNCDYCADACQLAEEITALSDELSLDVYDLEVDAEIARQYHVENAPGIVIAAKDNDQIKDLGIRYTGIPAGHEFGSFIQDILLASSRDSGLAPQTRTFLQSLTSPIHLQVFVTPT